MRNYCLILFILFSLCYIPASYAEKFYFEQISLNEGLSQSSVKAIYRDHLGILWIGTKEGLNRYNGQVVRTYYHESEQESSLPDNNVFFITEDASSDLWIGTGGTLCRYDRRSDTFIKEKINGNEISLRNILVRGNKMYATTGSSLLIYDVEKKQWTELIFHGDELNLTAASKIEYWDENTLLIGSRWKGLFLCNINDGKLTRTPFFRNEYVLDIYRNAEGNYWISEYGKGLICFDKKGKTIRNLQQLSGVYQADKIMDIIDHRGKLWMASDGEGVLTYDYVSGRLERINGQQKELTGVSVNSLLSLYVDSYNNMWLGTIRSGLLGVRKIFVDSYAGAPLRSGWGLSESTVLSFYEDEKEGRVWTGTDGQGINSFDVGRQQFTHYPATFGTKVTSISSYSEDKLILSLYKDGLVVFDKGSGQIRPLTITGSSDKNLFSNDWIGVNVLTDRLGNIYFAGEEVYQYLPDKRILKPLNIIKPGEGAVRLCTSAYLPNVVIMYNNVSVVRYNILNRRAEQVLKLPQTINGLINSVDVDNTGNYWLGMSNGLYKWLPETKTLERVFPERIKSVSTLLVDTRMSVWIASGISFYRYHIARNQIYTYGKADGLLPNEILPKSRLLSRNGDVYIGGVAGFSRIEKDIPFPEDIVPGFELLDVQLDGSLLSPERIKFEDGVNHLRIPWDHTSLQLNLFINTPSLTTLPRCRYLIEGTNTSFQNLETQSIRTQTLTPGSYKVLLEYELKDEKWSAPVLIAEIRVLSPWWQTWWFYMIVLALTASVLIRLRRIAVRKAKQSMEMEMQKHEQELAEQKIRFLINISHELRTPLTLVYAPLRRMLKDEATPAFFRPLLTLMYKHVKNMKNMIDMVLDVRKMEIKHETLNRAPYQVNEWIQNITEDFVFELQSKQLQLHLQTDERIQTVSFDRDRCDKVLSNLLMNAIKFSNEGGSITVSSVWLENKIRISVSDDGEGVPEEDVPNLFTRFYQARHQKGGSGIGLSYAKTQVELHGGTIGYRSLTPQGSEFWFELPLETVKVVSENTYEQILIEKQTGDNQDSIIMNDGFDLKLLTVLVVEDEPDLLAYMKDSLGEVFKKVIVAKQGEEALKKVHDYLPDLVISDVMMPVMDGFELCRLLKTDVSISHIPVILLTALSGDDSTLTGYKMGADIYLSKPFGVDLLVAILSNLFRSRQELKKRYAVPELNMSTQEITFSNADERFITKLIGFIQSRLDDSDLRIDDLAMEMAMSRTSFYNKVKLVTGMSANAFMTDYKIKQAILLLRNPDNTIQDISMQLGFINQRYFSTVFKQITGHTPSQYRKEILNH